MKYLYTIPLFLTLTAHAMTKKIETSQAPTPIGPFSQAVLTHNGFLYISGVLPVDQADGTLITNMEQATHQIMAYLQAILIKAGMNFGNVVKTTIYLVDMNDFATVNGVYGSYFKNVQTLPARETVGVAALPKGARIEISMVAVQ